MDNNVKILVDIENRIKSKESVIDSMIQSIQVEENIVSLVNCYLSFIFYNRFRSIQVRYSKIG